MDNTDEEKTPADQPMEQDSHPPADQSMEDVSPERKSPSDAGSTTPDAAETNNNDAVHDWSAFYDADGRLYYYNQVTGESSWDEPEKFNPPVEEEEEAREDTETQEVNKEAEPGGTTNEQSDGVWTVHQDDEGREYYYNEDTGVTQWEKPENFVSPEPTAEAAEEPAAQEEPSTHEPDADERREDMVAEEKIPEEAPGGPEEQIDPAVKKLEDAQKALNEPDAIMEPSCWNNVVAVVDSLGQAEGGPKAMQALVTSFHGETAVCGLLTKWLAELQTESSSGPAKSKSKDEKVSDSAANRARGIVEDVINRIAKERFTKTGGDNILNLDKKSVSFLEDMMDSSRWRKLLIDLSSTHKDSALLMYCLESISKRGFHREIAKRNNQSDHFAVYNAMIASEFSVVGKTALSACDNADVGKDMGLDGLIADLRRTCTSTSYTYLYAMELLRDLITVGKDMNGNEGCPRIHRAIRKWEKLQEDLENAMFDPSISTKGSSPILRKRRLDVALTMSDMYQRQRRRPKPSPDEMVASSANGNGKYSDSLESSLLSLLRRNYLGTRLDERLLDQLLQKETGLGASGEVGRLLLEQPLSISILLSNLFKPGASRLGTIQTKRKCARLVALAAVSAQESTDVDEVSTTEKLLSSSQLCAQVENMVSFSVSEEPITHGDEPSPGRKLSSLALECASVGQGVVMWAGGIARGPEFVGSASYPTLSPSILSLLRLVGTRHPFTRRTVIEVAFVFLGHSNSEISYRKMNELKEQTLRLLLFLLVKGEAIQVLGEISDRLCKQGESEIDASLVRYFSDGLLSVLHPPYSPPLVRSLSRFLSCPRCVEALKSSYFGQKSKGKLLALLSSFQDNTRAGDATTNDDLGSLVTIYK